MNFKELYKHTKDLNILYVEDDEKLLDETFDVFDDLFHSVDTAVNGQDALEQYKDYYFLNSSYYDLVITDLSMPVMDGYTLIKELRRIYKDQNIIVISAHNNSSRLNQLKEVGVTNFIMKPMDAVQLMNTLYSSCKNI